MLASALIAFTTSAILVCSAPSCLQAQRKKATKLPVELDRGMRWHRDPVTGEIRAFTSADRPAEAAAVGGTDAHTVVVRTQMVPVTCIVSTADGDALPGLRREEFNIFSDGTKQLISYFEASAQPASVALVVDASPSVLRDSQEMKEAADALVDALAPLDESAVVDFSEHTYLQTTFSDVREVIRRAVARIDVRALLGDTGGSNIYQTVYLTARLFQGRTGRKAILLLTDGQDSGLGLSLGPAANSSGPGRAVDKLNFDDVARLLAAQDIQVFAVSTENRPKVMTPEWLAAHENETLVTSGVRAQGIPAYTLYLAELVRRVGGQLYFLREANTMADTFRKIAERIRAEYTIGFYPSGGSDKEGILPGWHSLRVEIADQPGARITYRAAYYVPGRR
ncbi:MAG TPA: VWA domain-containing protein [Candidatus Acidoferrales bacterium]